MKMLYYKAWIETRVRFIAGLIAATIICVYNIQQHAWLTAMWAGELANPHGFHMSWMPLGIHEYGWYLWHYLFDNYLQQVWSLFAVLFAFGGLIRERSSGTVLFSLGLPVSRRRWLFTRLAVALIESVALSLFAVIVVLIGSAVIHQTFSLPQMLLHTALMIAAGIFIAVGLVCGPLLLGSDKGRRGQPAFARLTKPLAGLGCLAFCILLNEGAMADWSSVYMRRSLLTSEAAAATGYAAFSFAMAAGRVAGDWMTERFGRVAIVRFGALLSAVGLSLGLSFPHVYSTLGAFIAVGAGFSVIVPLAFGAAGRHGSSAGAGLAAVNTAGYLGFLSGPAIIGFSAEYAGLRASLGIVVALSLVVSSLARVVAVPGDATLSSAQEPVLQ